MILDAFDNWRAYACTPAWKLAFAWLSDVAPDIAPGDYPLDGRDIFASVFDFTTKNLLDATLEAHRIYADIHMDLPAPTGGPEVHARFDLNELTPIADYDPVRDAVRYEIPERFGALFTLHPGQFAVYFPQDGHLSQGKTGAAKEGLRKVVVKVKAELLRP